MKENIVFIFADQLRADFLGCYGADFAHTPNIDSIADNGVLYEDATTTAPLCVPARASLLTGMSSIANSVLGNDSWLADDISDYGINTWPELLGMAGYYTAAVGKMHFYPWDKHMGFKYRDICEDKRWVNVRDDYYKFLRENGYTKKHGKDIPGYFEGKGAMVSPIPWEYSVDHYVGKQSCKFIDTYGDDGPFALMVGFPGPHCPYDPTQKFLDMVDESKIKQPLPLCEHTHSIMLANIEGSKGSWNGVDYTEFSVEQKMNVRKHYIALILQIDYEVGQIIKALKQKGVYDNTTIIFASDHGDYMGDFGMMAKSSYLQPSIHVPIIVSRAGDRKSARYKEKVKLRDINSTLLNIAGIPIPKYSDSVALPSIGFGDRVQDYIYGANTNGYMIYDGSYKLCRYGEGALHLFDMKNDPNELNNLAYDAEYSDVKNELDKRLTMWLWQEVQKSHFHTAVVHDTVGWASTSTGFEGRKLGKKNMNERRAE